MDFIILIVFLGITLYSFISTGWHDGINTENSKRNARINGHLCYTQYNNKKRFTRLVSDNQKVYIVGKNVYDKRGKLLFNIDDLEIQRRTEYVKEYCKNKGYDFYPIVVKEKTIGNSKVRPTYRSFETNDMFKLCGENGDWDKLIVEKPEDIFIDAKEIVPHAYDFNHNINQELRDVLNKSRELFTIYTGGGM